MVDIDLPRWIKFISGGLMSVIRSPTVHEPAITWLIDKQDCLDLLSLISFIYKAVYYKPLKKIYHGIFN